MVLEHVIHEWHAFRRALRNDDRQAFDRLMSRARLHGGAASNAARLNPTEALFMAVLVEHEKELERLKAERNRNNNCDKNDTGNDNNKTVSDNV